MGIEYVAATGEAGDPYGTPILGVTGDVTTDELADVLRENDLAGESIRVELGTGSLSGDDVRRVAISEGVSSVEVVRAPEL
jgi:hypothetical protein